MSLAQQAQPAGDARMSLAPAGGNPAVVTTLSFAPPAKNPSDNPSGENTSRKSLSDKNPSVQCLRGVAALFVAMYHASGFAGYQFGDAGWAAVCDARFGLAGVAIFFAISGMLMAELIRRTDPWRFLAHRIVRIYPAYFLAVSVAAPVIALLGILKFGPHVFSLMLVPAGPRAYYLGVEWTLVFECSYYVALFLIAVAGCQRHINGIALTWLAAIGAAWLITGSRNEVFYPVYSIWLAPANAAFAGGLLIPWIGRTMRIPAGAGIVVFCAFMAAPPAADPTVARWAAGAAATLLVLDVQRMKGLPRALSGLRRLGDWSYALYLAHAPTIAVVYHFWPASAGAGGAWLAAIAAAVAVSAGFGTVDVRLYRRLKSAVDILDDKHRRRRVNAYAGAFVAASLISLVV